MIIIPHKQLAEQIPAYNRIFGCNGTKEDFHPPDLSFLHL